MAYLEEPANDSDILISLDSEELAAVEGWRQANKLSTKPQAIRELIRLGLLSEIAKVHKIVSGIREAIDLKEDRPINGSD